MRCFIKTEKFNQLGLELDHKERQSYIAKHKHWVNNLKSSGIQIKSGYLVNSERMPGGGGLLIIHSENFVSAKNIVKNDPMIKSGIVNWELQEWILINDDNYNPIT